MAHKQTIPSLNDGSQTPAYLRKDLNVGTIAALPRGSIGWRANYAEQLDMLKKDEHVAAQNWGRWEPIMAAGLRASSMANVLDSKQLDHIAREHKAAGCDYTNLHLGSNFASDAEMDQLAAAVLEASAKHAYPLLIETHRATMTQDMRRTLDLIERFPDLRFTADLSHWYAGHELSYGGRFEQIMQRLAPVFERVRAMHGRIASAGAIQIPIDYPGPALQHFCTMWEACFLGFLRSANAGDFFSFNAELLPMCLNESYGKSYIYYAQNRQTTGDDSLEGEPTDRYAEAQKLWHIAEEVFTKAQQQTQR
jgi:hypothetical protein